MSAEISARPSGDHESDRVPERAEGPGAISATGVCFERIVRGSTPLLPESLRHCYADGVANPDHLSVLLEGVEQWNTWRRAHPRVVPDLIEADLLKADLAGGNQRSANLYRANLRGSNLVGANLQGVNLRDATLTGAVVGSTIFGNTNLTGAQGLDTCRHSGPSVIDFQTLAISGPLPLVFLRGCGLPDSLIEY